MWKLLSILKDKDQGQRDESRDFIKGTHDAVGEIIENFECHVKHNNDKFNELIKQIDSIHCPRDKDMDAVLGHQVELNGGIARTEKAVIEIITQLSAIASETIGEKRAKKDIEEKRDKAEERKKNVRGFAIAVISVTLVGIGTIVTCFLAFKPQKEVNDNTVIIKELRAIALELKAP